MNVDWNDAFEQLRKKANQMKSSEGEDIDLTDIVFNQVLLVQQAQKFTLDLGFSSATLEEQKVLADIIRAHSESFAIFDMAPPSV